MPVTLSEKMAETRVVTVKWGEDDVDVSYYPNAVTPALLETVDEAAQRDDMSILGEALEPILDWWDVLDAKGKRMPTDKATIANMPLRWLTLVQSGIEEDQNPPEQGASANG